MTVAALAPPTCCLRTPVLHHEPVHSVFLFVFVIIQPETPLCSEPFQETGNLIFFSHQQIIQKDLEESLESRRTVWTRCVCVCVLL